MAYKDKKELPQLARKMNRVVNNLASFTTTWSPYVGKLDFEIIKVKHTLRK